MIERKMHKIDASGEIVGRLASRIAVLLSGKHKTSYKPNIDGGDIVEVSNVSKMKFSGKKMEQKKYFRHSGYPGGMKSKKVSEVLASRPGEVLRHAVREMLPGNKLRSGMLKRLISR